MNKHKVSEIILKKLQGNRKTLEADYHNLKNEIEAKFFILDDVLPIEITKSIYDAFPKNSNAYIFRNTFREKKFTFAKVDQLPSKIISEVTDAFHLINIVREVSNITAISNLEPDPSLYAGGISKMDKTHFLNPHIDNSHDGKKEKYRRLNLLFYVTPDIKEADGGNFELWNKAVTKNIKIPAKFNRLVVMETAKNTWHSVDEVKSNISRCCLSNYYFSKNSPEINEYYHVTSFMGRPEEKFRRFYGKIDNAARQTFANLTGVTTGQKLSRYKN